MNHWLNVTSLCLNAINVILHVLGAYLLICLYRRCRYKPQRLYIINLAVSECLSNLFELLRTSLEFIPQSFTVREVRMYLHIIVYTGLSIVYFLIMIYITADRLIHVYLNLKYPTIWNVARTKHLIVFTWCVGGITIIGVSILYWLTRLPWEDDFYKFVYPPMEAIFLILAAVTYTLIFRKYSKSQKKLSTFSKSSNRSLHKPSWFKNSFINVPGLLIVSFSLLVVIPAILYLTIGILEKNRSDLLETACSISYSCANCIDAGIYIFLQDDVRKLLMKKFRRSRLDVHSMSRTQSWMIQLRGPSIAIATPAIIESLDEIKKALKNKNKKDNNGSSSDGNGKENQELTDIRETDISDIIVSQKNSVVSKTSYLQNS